MSLSSVSSSNANNNFTQDLHAALRESRAALDAMVEAEMRAASEAAAAANRQIAEQQRAVDAANAELLELELHGLSVNEDGDGSDSGQQNGGSAAERQELEEAVQKQQSENEKLEASLQAEKKKMEELIEEHKQQKVRVQQTQRNWDAAKAAKQTTVDDLTRGIVNYKYLGLDFEKADHERLRFSFTQLDAHHPDRKFSFELAATDCDDRWTVAELDPPGAVAPDRLEELLAPLNDTNDMMPFVRGMRRAFLESIH